MMFNFAESEFINSFTEDITVLPTRESFIERLLASGTNNEDQELTDIANSAVNKLRIIDEHTFVKLISNLPVDTFTRY